MVYSLKFYDGKVQTPITQKAKQCELLFFHATRLMNLINNPTKYHRIASKNLGVIERTSSTHENPIQRRYQ